jgi:cytidyltransferase-like protein
MNHTESVAVYTGSFDPITLGHWNVIRRSSRLFDRLIVGVGVNPRKPRCFPARNGWIRCVESWRCAATSRSVFSPVWRSSLSGSAEPES